MASGLSFLKLAMVLWSGESCSMSHIISILRLHSFSKIREERIRFKYP